MKKYETTEQFTEEEFTTVTTALAGCVKYGKGCDKACARCPFSDLCGKEELFWGCGAWEEGMGDDL